MLYCQDSASVRAVLVLGAMMAMDGCAGESDKSFRTVSEADVSQAEESGAKVTSTTAGQRHADSTQKLQTTSAGGSSNTDAVSAGSDWIRSPEDSLAEFPAPQIRVLIPQRQFAPEGPQDALRVSFDDFDLEKVLGVTIPDPEITRHFPDWLNDLHGQRIRVRGFMMPTFQAEGLTRFVLARDTETCCFGPNGKIYHLVSVALQDGVTTDYIELRPFDVEGIFRIAPVADGGVLLQLYQLDDAVMIDK